MFQSAVPGKTIRRDADAVLEARVQMVSNAPPCGIFSQEAWGQGGEIAWKPRPKVPISPWAWCELAIFCRPDPWDLSSPWRYCGVPAGPATAPLLPMLRAREAHVTPRKQRRACVWRGFLRSNARACTRGTKYPLPSGCIGATLKPH